MTNSHNRTMGGSRNAERYAHGTSPPHHSNSGSTSSSSGVGIYFSNRKGNLHRGSIFSCNQRSSTIPNTTSYHGGNSLLSSSPPRSGNNRYFKNNNNQNNNNNNYYRTNGIQVLLGGTGGGNCSDLFNLSPTLPTNLTHFAGSKCFDAPAPTALPKPPQHWTTAATGSQSTQSSSMTSAGAAAAGTPSLRRSQTSAALIINKAPSLITAASNQLLIDSHNLKTLLNVQA